MPLMEEAPFPQLNLTSNPHPVFALQTTIQQSSYPTILLFNYSTIHYSVFNGNCCPPQPKTFQTPNEYIRKRHFGAVVCIASLSN